ncbi:DnaA ATPase domain-containing protein [Pseudoponticoccus marisrubri]|uniref:Chromosomal replication initiator DnaA n=1 Tax=Pseudoponticoccus marisrubri TaxID=1685382 RepID=A0A0W7WN43_9RHOB|nr:DnaA/Hda family protein [Pseudoponticoccus marisrubri]KUF12021.1 chromosomal replication initiator DnaA [Pseudoponticoccus marisrubri]
MSDARQLPLPLPTRPALGREDFYVTPANRLAVAQIEGWQTWPARKMVLTGPEGAGKTHLAHVWARLAQARIVAAEHLTAADIPALAGRPVCVEDADRIAGARAAEEALFHLHNLVLAEGHALLVTARLVPEAWPLLVPDLRSRILGAQAAQLDDPDDDLLAALLVKLFADRQIVPAPDVIPYLARRMPRRYRFAQDLVAALDRAALGRPKGVSRPLAAEVLARLDPPEAPPVDNTG